MTASCPCCGAPINGAVPIIELPRVAQLSVAQATIFYALARRPGERVTMERVIAALYGDDPDGGPDNAAGVVRTHMCNLRGKTEPFGWSVNGRGNSGYALVAVPQ